MVNVRVLEAADDLHDGVHLADVAEEFVAETFARARALDEAGDVHEFDGRGDDACGLGDFGERFEPGVRHGDDADVRVNGAKGIIFRRAPCGCA